MQICFSGITTHHDRKAASREAVLAHVSQLVDNATRDAGAWTADCLNSPYPQGQSNEKRIQRAIRRLKPADQEAIKRRIAKQGGLY